MKAPNKIKSAIAQLIDGYLELHRTGYGMVNVNTVLEDLENLAAIIDSEEDETITVSQWKPTQKQIDLLQSFVSDTISLGKKAELKSIIGGLKQLKK